MTDLAEHMSLTRGTTAPDAVAERVVSFSAIQVDGAKIHENLDGIVRRTDEEN